MNTTENKTLQWHPAFYAGIQIELSEEADNLTFENEHQLGTKPKEIDVLIIKKEADVPIRKNIGKIFRKYNIVEYKSPDDYLSIDDFYLVYAYACLYKSDTRHVDEIPVEEITLSFVCSRYPRGLLKHLANVRKYQIEKTENGIYHVKGDFFPIQIIHTKGLSNENNLWLHNLTNDIKEKQVAEKLITEYQKHNRVKLYSSVMNIITAANKETFMEVTDMCEALEQIYLEVHGERLEREKQKAIDEAVSKAVAKAVSEAVAEKDAQLNKEKELIQKLLARIAEYESQAAKQNL